MICRQHIYLVLLGAVAPAVSSPNGRAKYVENSPDFLPNFLHPNPSNRNSASAIIPIDASAVPMGILGKYAAASILSSSFI